MAILKNDVPIDHTGQKSNDECRCDISCTKYFVLLIIIKPQSLRAQPAKGIRQRGQVLVFQRIVSSLVPAPPSSGNSVRKNSEKKDFVLGKSTLRCE